jgi:hypothetical protein
MPQVFPPVNNQPKNKAVIVGNGVSLNVTPLERIIYPTFAVNRIHKFYPFTTWRPDYYVRTEPVELDPDPDNFHAECRLHVEAGERCFFPKPWKEWMGEYPNVIYGNTCRHFSRNYTPSGWHLPMVCDYGTVITAAIQRAVIEGYQEVCLVGCDLTGSHFIKDYHGAIQTELWMKAHELAKQECPIPIFNCTIGGALEVYERRPIEYIC